MRGFELEGHESKFLHLFLSMQLRRSGTKFVRETDTTNSWKFLPPIRVKLPPSTAQIFHSHPLPPGPSPSIYFPPAHPNLTSQNKSSSAVKIFNQIFCNNPVARGGGDEGGWGEEEGEGGQRWGELRGVLSESEGELCGEGVGEGGGGND